MVYQIVEFALDHLNNILRRIWEDVDDNRSKIADLEARLEKLEKE